MRIIFSRKGFDSEYGGVPSPILPNGIPLSLPIPTEHGPTTYQDITTPWGNMGDIVHTLTQGRIDRNHYAHLDPDIDPRSLSIRPDGWVPSFGQELAAQSHLTGQNVGPGDIFLFFGWFRPTEIHEGTLRYIPKTQAVHQLFGWFQIDRVLPIGDALDEKRNQYHHIHQHPHLHAHGGKMNTIYTATPTLSLPNHAPIPLPGAGIFPGTPNHQLSVPNQSKRSLWTLPHAFHPMHGRSMSYHQNPDRWTEISPTQCTLQSVAKGQEFVYNTHHHPDIIQWLHGLLPKHQI